MQRVVQIPKADEARAMQILFRHFSGRMLPNRIYIVDEAAITALAAHGIDFDELSGLTDIRFEDDHQCK